MISSWNSGVRRLGQVSTREEVRMGSSSYEAVHLKTRVWALVVLGLKRDWGLVGSDQASGRTPWIWSPRGGTPRGSDPRVAWIIVGHNKG